MNHQHTSSFVIIRTITWGILFLSLFLPSCTPEIEPCDLDGISVGFNVKTAIQGMEVIIQGPQVSYILDKSIYIRPSLSLETPVRIESLVMTERGLNEVKLFLPVDVLGRIDVLIKDPRCGEFIYLGDLDINNAEFFMDNPNFITPILPQFLSGSLPSFPPIDISNAWISSIDRTYCLWFGGFLRHFIVGGDGKAIDEDPLTPEIDTIFVTENGENTAGILDERSIELSINCFSGINTLNHLNPVSGIVDFANNYIRIFVDRTSNFRVRSVEEYVGSFVSPDEIPENLREYYLSPGICAADNDPLKAQRNTLMLLTSQKTGHQLLLFKLVQEGD